MSILVINGVSEESLHQLEDENILLLVALVVVCTGMLVLLWLYAKNRKAHSLLVLKTEQIERHHRENDEIMQILQHKKEEIEQQTIALNETTVELNWQTENALRLYDEVEQQRRVITDSIVYAKQIQTALLPDISAVNEILNDYFVLYKPRDIVSGDFYWVAAKQNKTIVAVAD